MCLGVVPNPRETLRYRLISRTDPLPGQHRQPARLSQAGSPPAPKLVPCAVQGCTLELSTVHQTLPCLGASCRPLLPLLVSSTVALCQRRLRAPSITSCPPPGGSLWHCQHWVLLWEGWPKGAEVPAVGLGVPACLCQVEMALWSLQQEHWGGTGPDWSIFVRVLWPLPSFS